MEIIKRDNVADAIYDALYQKIASGQWAEGDKIPNEFVLCEELGVSRVSVRSAIQRFVALGMLEVKRGDGTYVKNFSLQEYLQQAVPFIIRSEDRQDMIEFREALESKAVRMAVELHNEEEIEELIRLFHVSNDAFKRCDLAAYVALDMDFHRYLCAMSHNKILVTMWDAFVRPLSETVRYTASNVITSGVDVEDHHLLIALAIRERNVEKALHNLHIVLEGVLAPRMEGGLRPFPAE